MLNAHEQNGDRMPDEIVLSDNACSSIELTTGHLRWDSNLQQFEESHWKKPL
jgi:hypothetical protein